MPHALRSSPRRGRVSLRGALNGASLFEASLLVPPRMHPKPLSVQARLVGWRAALGPAAAQLHPPPPRTPRSQLLESRASCRSRHQPPSPRHFAAVIGHRPPCRRMDIARRPRPRTEPQSQRRAAAHPKPDSELEAAIVDVSEGESRRDRFGSEVTEHEKAGALANLG